VRERTIERLEQLLIDTDALGWLGESRSPFHLAVSQNCAAKRAQFVRARGQAAPPVRKRIPATARARVAPMRNWRSACNELGESCTASIVGTKLECR
jgi:hypothetical protein